MKDNTKKKAPKVSKYNMDKNFMRESDKMRKRTSPMQPMKKKRLS